MRIILFYITVICSYAGVAQTGLYINGDVASLRVDSTGFLSVNGDFQNLECDIVKQVRFNGTLYLAGSLLNSDSLKFNASAGNGNSKKALLVFRNSTSYTLGINAVISGTVSPVFWELEINKPGGSLTLQNDVRLKDTIEFKQGHIFMNGRKWNLVDPFGAPTVINHPFIKNEKRNSRFMPASLTDTGQVIYHTHFFTSNDINPANIGIVVTGSLDIQSDFSVYRGFKTQVNAGKTSVQRYFDLYSPAYSLVANNVHVAYNYRDFENFNNGYVNRQKLKLCVSQSGDINWSMIETQKNIFSNVYSSSTDTIFSASLSGLQHPNTNIDGTSFRITIADSDCPNPPVSLFTADTLHICAGDSVVLDGGNNTSIPNTSLKWQWNSNPPSYVQTYKVGPDTTFQKFKVLLKDVRGCTSSDSVILAPAAPFPVVSYFNHLNSCIGDSVTIKDSVRISSGTFNNSWTFSDGSSGSQLKNMFRKKFNTPGLHAMALTVTSNHGCTVSVTSTNIVVYNLPSVSFIHDFDCISGATNFTSTSASNYTSMAITSNSWNFGQGNSVGTSVSPSFTYTGSGKFPVKLISTTSFGCRDSIVDSVIVHPKNTAQFSLANVCDGDSVHLVNNSVCNTGNCNSFWDLGDATNSQMVSFSKLYTTSGLYTIKLKLTGNVGCPDSISLSVFVNPVPTGFFTAQSQSVCENSALYFTNTSSVSAGIITSYLWKFGNAQTSTQVNATNMFNFPGVDFASLTVVSDSGCVSSFSMPVTVHPRPVAQFSANTVCQKNPTTLFSGSSGNNISYVWDYGDGSPPHTGTSNYQKYTYSSAGSFSANLINISPDGCSDTAYAIITVLQNPTIGLGGNLSTCGTTYTLNANNPGSIFSWYPGNQTTQTILINNNGEYHVTVTAPNGCSAKDSANVTLNNNVEPALGNDTTSCGGIYLNAGYPGSAFLWNTGGTSQYLYVANSGTFSVLVTDANGCIGADSISVQILPAAFVNLGPNVTSCESALPMIITPTTNGSSFLWNNASTVPALSTTVSGTYWLSVTAGNGCKAKDTVKVSLLPSPKVYLGGDRSACGQVLLDAQNPGYSHNWSKGQTTQTILATSTEKYKVVVTNTVSGCTGADSVSVNIFPVVTVNLGPDLTVCSGSNFKLHAGNPGAEYKWSTGNVTEQITINSTGLYGVTVKSQGGCSGSDYIFVTLIPSPFIDIGSSIRYLCGNTPVRLESNHQTGLKWGSSNGLSTSSPTVFAQLEGKYWATVSVKGCESSDTTLIFVTNNTIQANYLASTQDTVNHPVQFVNLSKPEPVSQLWIFGDGLTATDKNPQHTFVIPQTFSVTLEVSNGFCTDVITKEINVLFKKVKGDNQEPVSILSLLDFRVYPNPANEILNIDFSLNDFGRINLTVSDLSGRIVRVISNSNDTGLKTIMETGSLPKGLYILSISAESLKGNINRTTKFIKH